MFFVNFQLAMWVQTPNSRWRHPELRGCSAETAVLGKAQKHLHAVERTLPDCEVMLHSPSTLSRIVARGKRSYVANQERGRRREPGRSPTSCTPVFVTENKGACRDRRKQNDESTL